MIRTGLSMTKPGHRDGGAGERVQQRDHDRHVGAADRQGHRDAEDQRGGQDHDHDRDVRGARSRTGTARRATVTARQARRHELAARDHDRLAGDQALELARGDERAGERDRADDDVEDDEDVARRAGRRRRRRQAEVVVDRDQGRRAAADRVEQRHQLRHRGHLHGPGGVQARARRRAAMPTTMISQRRTALNAVADRAGGRGSGSPSRRSRPSCRRPTRGCRCGPWPASSSATRPRTKQTAPTEPGDPDEDLDDPERGPSRPGLRVRARRASAHGRLLAEHLEHPVGDDVAADDVHRRERHGDERQQLADRVVASAAISIAPTRTIPWIELAPDISGRVERRRDLADDREADEDRQREDRQVVEQAVDLGGSCRASSAAASGAGSSSFLTALATRPRRPG